MTARQELPTIDLFGIRLHRLRMAEAVDAIYGWLKQPCQRCRYVVTPNVDHVVMLRENHRLAAAYQHADLVLADGFPIVWASRLFGRSLPERVAGSDLVPALFDAAAADRQLNVFWLGAAPGVAQRAAELARLRWPFVHTVGWDSPPIGFERSALESQRILEKISAARPDIVLIGLGAPKQELWIHQHRECVAAKVALCVGATIDFLAGHRKRAPLWMRAAGLEWLHRMASEPRRLVKRYARDAWVFPQILWQQARTQRT